VTCREAIALMSDYLDLLLDDDGAQALEAHLRGCAPCEAYLNTLRRTRDVTAAEAARVEMPPEMRERLRRFLLERLRASGDS